MFDGAHALLLGLVAVLALAGSRSAAISTLFDRIREFAHRSDIVILSIIAGCTFTGCFAVAGLIHEPVPRITDEFSYLLMGDTFAAGHVSNPSPPLSEFFDTFHVLVHPAYVSKYFPGQGFFLALGQRLTGHPAVGIWLSSALACAAMFWMLKAWVGPTWGLLGSVLMVSQFGVFSYWSQSYWGGMVAALGGALYFGAIRRLWDQITWQSSLWAGLGIVILANSRPLEGALATLPITIFFLVRIVPRREWAHLGFWRIFALPAGAVLLVGAAATGTYNRTITGSFRTPPYVLHEKQYQESPQFVFLPLRPKITYSSPWLQYLYEVNEMRLYLSQRTPLNIMLKGARKLTAWWFFYCGILLSAPLLLMAWLRGGRLRYLQAILLVGFIAIAIFYVQQSAPLRIAIDILVLEQFVVLWFAFESFWPRLALATIGILLVESLFVKYAFAHYFAPITCLVLFLQVAALKRLWHWRADATSNAKLSRQPRRKAARSATGPKFPFRGFVALLPLACLASLILRVEARANRWSIDIHPPDIDALLTEDWSLKRAALQKSLEDQAGQDLVFVRYFPQHDVDHEWVWNRADLMHAKVVWARDLGSDHNQLLLRQMPGRKVWSLLADLPDPRLVPYSEVLAHAPHGLPPPDPPVFPDQEEP